MNEKNSKRGGYYWNEGKPFISVTQILEVIEKPDPRQKTTHRGNSKLIGGDTT